MENLKPLSRKEHFDFAFAGLIDTYPEPVTRKEKIYAAMIERLASMEKSNKVKTCKKEKSNGNQ